MRDIFTRAGDRRGHHWRGGVCAVAVVAMSVTVAGCGSNGSGSGSTAAAGGGGGGASSAPSTTSSSSSSSSSTSASGGGGGITAKGVSLPSGTPGKGKPEVVMGSKNFAEETLLNDLYQTALKAKGFKVKQKLNVGASGVIDTAFKSGQIDLYPEYLGEIVTSVAKQKPDKTAVATYNAAKKFEESQRDATLLKQTPFQDVDVLFVKTSLAKKDHLKSIGDLTNVGPKGKGTTYVAQPPNRTRYAGLKGLKQAYGLTAMKFVGAPPGQQYKAIDHGNGNVGDAFSTDPTFAAGVKAGKYVALKDPKAIMGFQHVAPVVKKSVLKKEGPAFAQTMNWVSSLLTLKAVQTMDIAVQTNHKDPGAVAKQYLQANGL